LNSLLFVIDHRFDHDQAERFGPLDRKEQRSGARQKRLFLFVVHFPHQPDLGAIDLRFEVLLEIAPFAARRLRGDAKRHPGGARDADRASGPFSAVRRPRKAR
jgi:hypothetical protein